MKKKITALCLVVALALVAIGGATMAYFTDHGQQENTFAIGNIDIKVDEWGNVKDADGNFVSDAFSYDDNGMYYTNIMPSYVMTKKPVISNESTRNAAYVRVAVVVNNLSEINNAIDTVYEAAGKNETEIQAIYDNVFNGWGIQHGKDAANGWVNRMWMQKPTDSKVLAVDYIRQFGSPEQGASYGYIATSKNNTFKTADELHRNDGFVYNNWNEKSYYSDAASTESLIYAYYIKLAPGDSYTLFNGLNIPADFDNNREVGDDTINQMAMFTGLNIGIYADAIQAEGFTDTSEDGVTTLAWVNAINALNEAHPVGYWKN